MWSQVVKCCWRDASDIVLLDQVIAIDAVNLYDQLMDIVRVPQVVVDKYGP